MNGHAVCIRRDHSVLSGHALLYGGQPPYKLVVPIRKCAVEVNKRIRENAQRGEEQLSKGSTPACVRFGTPHDVGGKLPPDVGGDAWVCPPIYP